MAGAHAQREGAAPTAWNKIDNRAGAPLSLRSFARNLTPSMRAPQDSAWVKMDDLTDRESTAGSTGKNTTTKREVIDGKDGDSAGLGSAGAHAQQRDGRVHIHGAAGDDDAVETGQVGRAGSRWRRFRKHRRSWSHTHYRVYKRRWFGLAQLVLLNTVVSWDWLTFAPVSTSSAQYFGVTESTINWLSTAFLLSFVVASPLVIWTLNRSPKESIIVSSVFLLLGNWIRYGGTQAASRPFGVVMFGQILTGLAQPFVLAAPTRYSDLWFTESGRVSATALASLANPFGGALAQLINPALGDINNIVLYVAIISSVATIPSFFIPAAPPTPPCASAAVTKEALLPSIRHILRSPPFYVVALTFGTYTGLFNAFASLLNQILYPYGYSEDEAGICGAILIVVGLVTAAITSPIFDRTHAYLTGIKILCAILAAAYLGFVWAPQTRDLPAPFALAAIVGATSFSLLPISLEYLVEITYPASPAVGSTIIWTCGQLFGAIFIVIMNAMKDQRPVDLEQVRHLGRGQGTGDRPPGNMYRALVFQGAFAFAVLPFPLALGIKRLGLHHGEGRLMVDVHREGGEEGAGTGEEGS